MCTNIISYIFYRNASQAGLQLAKRNIERFYSVVGILEEFDKFWEVLEEVMPQFFRNASTTESRNLCFA